MLKRFGGAILTLFVMAGCAQATPLAPALTGQTQILAKKSDALAPIMAKIHAAMAAKQQRPIVIFDLDDTLFATAPRTFAILQDWRLAPEAAPYKAAVEKFSLDQVGYSINDCFKVLGVPETQWPAARQFWGDRFFASAYLKYDKPFPNAVAYARSLNAAGARIVYLTGRSEEMRVGTEGALRANGFPWDPKGQSTQLIIKPDKTWKDVEYKAARVEEIKKLGPVVASFENEPRNANMFRKALPEAVTVFIDKPHSPEAPPLEPGIVGIKDYPPSK